MSCLTRFEPQHWPCDPLHTAMIRLNHVVERRDLADGDRRAVLRVVALDGGFMSPTAIARHLVRHAMTANRFRQNAQGSPLIQLLRQQNVKGLAVCVHGAIEVALFAFGLDGGLVQPPTDSHRPLTAMKRFLQRRTVPDHPAVHGGVMHVETAPAREFFDMASAQWIRHLSTNPRQHHFLWEMGTLDARGH